MHKEALAAAAPLPGLSAEQPEGQAQSSRTTQDAAGIGSHRHALGSNRPSERLSKHYISSLV